jgi:sterol desaturase/sphingolipid hydroxylase (fatty acid hydroxylase superfamily)
MHEAPLRLGAFASMLCAMTLWELWRPWRQPIDLRRKRWPVNLGILVLSTVVVRGALPLGVIAAAIGAEQDSFGLLHQLALPPWVQFCVALLALDFVIYLQHILFHKVPWLWRLHRVHHSDRDFDATSALRFHPIEILMSAALKILIVTLLGAPALAVLAFEVILNSAAMFNHSNASLPPALDRFVRLILVTPDMHRVHHSTLRLETDSNYGFNLPLWDRIFGTYRAEAARGRADVQIGTLEEAERSLGLVGLLLLPFRRRR